MKQILIATTGKSLEQLFASANSISQNLLCCLFQERFKFWAESVRKAIERKSSEQILSLLVLATERDMQLLGRAYYEQFSRPSWTTSRTSSSLSETSRS